MRVLNRSYWRIAAISMMFAALPALGGADECKEVTKTTTTELDDKAEPKAKTGEEKEFTGIQLVKQADGTYGLAVVTNSSGDTLTGTGVANTNEAISKAAGASGMNGAMGTAKQNQVDAQKKYEEAKKLFDKANGIFKKAKDECKQAADELKEAKTLAKEAKDKINEALKKDGDACTKEYIKDREAKNQEPDKAGDQKCHKTCGKKADEGEKKANDLIEKIEKILPKAEKCAEEAKKGEEKSKKGGEQAKGNEGAAKEAGKGSDSGKKHADEKGDEGGAPPPDTGSNSDTPSSTLPETPEGPNERKAVDTADIADPTKPSAPELPHVATLEDLKKQFNEKEVADTMAGGKSNAAVGGGLPEGSLGGSGSGGGGDAPAERAQAEPGSWGGGGSSSSSDGSGRGDSGNFQGIPLKDWANNDSGLITDGKGGSPFKIMDVIDWRKCAPVQTEKVAPFDKENPPFCTFFRMAAQRNCIVVQGDPTAKKSGDLFKCPALHKGEAPKPAAAASAAAPGKK